MKKLTPEEALDAPTVETSLIEAEAAASEREAIVAWIRRYAEERGVIAAFGIAAAIEDGEHLWRDDDEED